MPLMLTPEGVAVDVPIDQVQRAKDIGYRNATPEQAAADLTRPESGGGGLGGAALAGITSALSGATLGGSDVLIGAAAPVGDVRAVREAREAHPVVSGVSGVAGAIAPALLTGGDSLLAAPTRLVGEGGAAVARAGEAAGLGRIGGAALGGAAEGALYGAGSGVSELALSDDPLTVERIGSALSSNMLFGGVLGAGVGTLARSAELGLSRAKQAIDGALERRFAKATTTAEAIESGDFENVGVKELRAARESELEAIRQSQLPEREAFVRQLRSAREADAAAEPWKATQGYPDRAVRGLSKEYLEADIKLTNLLKNEKGLVERPGSALDALQRQEQAIERLSDKLEADYGQWLKEAETARPAIRDEIRARDPSSLAWKNGERGPFNEAGLDSAVEREYGRRYPEMATDSPPERFRSQDSLIDALGRNLDLQQKIRTLSRAPASPKLEKIDEALDVLGQPKAPSLGAAVASAVIPFAGPLGAAAATGGRVVGNFKKIADALTERAGKAASSFLGVASKGTAAAAPYAPVVATKVLAAVRFGDRRDKNEAGADDLPALYKRRTDEIKSQITVTPEGQYQMRPDARAKMATAFDGLRVAAPLLADKLEEQSARKIEWLAGQIPRKPDVLAMNSGGANTWHPSYLEMRSLARKVSAAEDPHAALDRLAHGAITPEDSAALRAVYPELMQDITERITSQLPELRKSLPHDKRIALSIFTGVPVDPALDPQILARLQMQFSAEPGSDGGAHAPRTAPAAGAMRSLSKDTMTPAQERVA